MDLELQDKVVIVGGASKGLGRACAEALAEEGAKVAICSRTQADLEQAAQEIRDATDTDVLTFAGDLDHYDTIRDLIATTVARFGRLDILVNNSGGPPLARAYNATEEQWATAVQRSLLFFARMSTRNPTRSPAIFSRRYSPWIHNSSRPTTTAICRR